ncbi:MAG: hypothetical protein ABI983_00655 [Acidobacteriota bacterium]
MFGVTGSASAQPSDTESAAHLKAGRDALARDPGAAIAQLEQVHTREGYEWLTIALMMESRSASDQFVERAFEAAGRARIGAQMRPRADMIAALRPGDMVVAFFVGETDVYAWAFDRAGFAGYQLPPRAEISTSTDRARAYIDQHDREGLQRIAEDLVPVLFGPALERLSQTKRLIVVADGPLQQLSIGALPAGEGQPPLQQRVEVVPAEYGSVVDMLAREQTGPAARDTDRASRLMLIGGIALAILLIAAIVVRRKP